MSAQALIETVNEHQQVTRRGDRCRLSNRAVIDYLREVPLEEPWPVLVKLMNAAKGHRWDTTTCEGLLRRFESCPQSYTGYRTEFRYYLNNRLRALDQVEYEPY
jgi:hypothetical protein